MWKIFLSSTAMDLAGHREAVAQALARLDSCHCVRMEDFGSRAASALHYCQQRVQACDVFLGIIGHRYGSAPANSEVSFTEHEYEAAVTKGMPRFIFLAEEGTAGAGPPEEKPAQRSALARFRTRLAAEQVVGFFRTPEDLAVGATAGLSNWLLDGAASHRAEQNATPSLGPMAPKMCDRKQWAAEFRFFLQSKLREAPGRPQVCFVRGQESERGDSFSERIIATSVRDYANAAFSEKGGAVLSRAIEWPPAGDPAVRWHLLRANLFREIDPDYEYRFDDFSPAAFARLCAALLHPVLVFTHELRTARWNASEAPLLAEYLRFWDGFGEIAGRKQALVIMNLIHPEPAGQPRWKRLLARQTTPARIQSELLALLNARQAQASAGFPRSPCLLLPELSPIPRDDVMEWFRQHQIFEDMKTWQEHCRQLFGKEETRTMAEVEFALKSIHREFLHSRL